jgi:hypothetical protein
MPCSPFGALILRLTLRAGDLVSNFLFPPLHTIAFLFMLCEHGAHTPASIKVHDLGDLTDTFTITLDDEKGALLSGSVRSERPFKCLVQSQESVDCLSAFSPPPLPSLRSPGPQCLDLTLQACWTSCGGPTTASCSPFLPSLVSAV